MVIKVYDKNGNWLGSYADTYGALLVIWNEANQDETRTKLGMTSDMESVREILLRDKVISTKNRIYRYVR